MSDKIVMIEPKWVRYLKEIDEFDLHIVKELITYEDGRKEPRLKFIHNFRRPFWIDKRYNPTVRNNKNLYKTRKEFLPEKDLKKFMSTQTDLYNEISMRTGKGGRKKSTKRDHEENVYIYGSNIPSEVFVKMAYKDKYNYEETESSIAVLDIEADIKTGTLLVNSIAMNDKLYMAINRDMFPANKYVEEQVIQEIKDGIIEEYKGTTIGNTLKEIVIEFCDELETAINPVMRAHEWEPDYLLGWNIRFDVVFINDVLEKYGVRPEDIWSSPDIDEKLRVFKMTSKNAKPEINKKPITRVSSNTKFTTYTNREYGRFSAILGRDFMITAGGVRKNKSPEEKYDVFETLSSFTILDSMQIFRINRSTEGKLNGGYSLANVLKLYTSIGKLTLEPDEESKKLFGLDKHEYMVDKYPVKYCIYNAGDILGILEFEAVTGDVSISLGIFAGMTPLKYYSSGPQRLQTFYFNYALNRGYVLGNPRSKRELDKEEELLGRKNFTLTLGSELKYKTNLGITNYINIENKMELMSVDLDQSSGYPSNTIATRMSINTVEKEFKAYTSLRMEQAKLANMGLIYGQVNHYDFVTTVYGFPNITDVITDAKREFLELTS